MSLMAVLNQPPSLSPPSPPSTPPKASPAQRPSPGPLSIFYPAPLHAPPLRPVTLTSSFSPPDFNEHRYHLPVLLYDLAWYSALPSPPLPPTSASPADWDSHVEGNRFVLERLDYRCVLSVYFNSFRLFSFPISRRREREGSASPPSSSSPSPTPRAPPLRLTDLPGLVPGLRVLHCASMKSSHSFLLPPMADTASLHRFVALVAEVAASPRSDVWLDVPDAQRTQAALRAWEEDMERAMVAEEKMREAAVVDLSADDDREAKASFVAPGSRSPSPSPFPSPVPVGFLSSSLRGSRSLVLPPPAASSSRSSHLGGLKNLGNSCFPECDTRVLTDSGFLFLGQVEQRLGRGERVRYACYQPSTQSIVYCPGRLVYSTPPKRWVEFTQASSRRLWPSGGSSGRGGVKSAQTPNHVTLRTTPDHGMYVQPVTRSLRSSALRCTGKARDTSASPRVMTAEELTPGFACDCSDAGLTCTHGSSAYRFFTAAPRGIEQPPASCLSLDDGTGDSPIVALRLRTGDQILAFLELYGYWLGQGCLSHGVAHPSDVEMEGDAVVLSAVKGDDRGFLLDRIRRLHLHEGDEWLSSERALHLTVRITAPCWIRYFHAHGAQPLWPWVQRLTAEPLRVFLEGVRRGGGGAARPHHSQGTLQATIDTSSVVFREQLLQLCLHAGYSAHFTLGRAAGDVRGFSAVAADGLVYSAEERDELLQIDPSLTFEPVRSPCEVWSVHYSDSTCELLPAEDVRFDGAPAYSRPFPSSAPEAPRRRPRRRRPAKPAADPPSTPARAELYDEARDGRVWCVEVAHADHLIFVQRASVNAHGVVTQVGRAVIASNCYMNAILQALLSLPSFTQALTSSSLISSAHSLPTPLPADSFYASLVHLALQMRQSDHGVLDIQRLKDVIGGRYARFAGNAQQDAHEFLSECLNCLHDDILGCLRPADGGAALARGLSGDSGSDDSSGGTPSRSPSPMPLPLQSSTIPLSTLSPLPRSLLLLSHRLSPVYRTFHFEIEYRLQCTNERCGYTRTNHETFYDLSLDIPDPAPLPPLPTSSSSPVLSPTRSPSPDRSPTASPLPYPIAPPSPPLPPLQLTPAVSALSASQSLHQPPPRSASPSVEGAAHVPRRRQKQSGPPSSSLSSLLSTFFSPRTLSCKCSHCDNTEVRVSSTVARLPRVLILHLKRFLPNVVKGSYEKRSDRVKVEREVDLTFACTPTTRRPGDGDPDTDPDPATPAPDEVKRPSDAAADAAADEESKLDASPPPPPPRSNGRPAFKRLSEEMEIDLTAGSSDDSESSPTAAAAAADSAKRHKAEGGRAPSPAPVPGRPSRRRPTADAELRVTRAMHRKTREGGSVAAAAPVAAAVAEVEARPPPPPRVSPRYRLSAIVHHKGSAAYAGHYVADLVTGSASWVRYDDQFVREISAEQALRQAESEGYIFLFQTEMEGEGR